MVDILQATFSTFTEICSYVWWRHQMETFSALLAICAGNSSVPREFPAQRPVTRSFDVSFDLRLNKRLSKQSWGWWFETLPLPLWRHSNGFQRKSNRICLGNGLTPSRHGIDLVITEYYELPFIVITIYGVVCVIDPFYLSWLKGCIYSSCYYHHQIGNINLTHCDHIFPWLCAWEKLHIHSGKTGIFVFVIIVQSMMSANSRIRFGLEIVFVCLCITPSHYHHCANIFEDVEFIKCLPDIFCRLCE